MTTIEIQTPGEVEETWREGDFGCFIPEKEES